MITGALNRESEEERERGYEKQNTASCSRFGIGPDFIDSTARRIGSAPARSKQQDRLEDRNGEALEVRLGW